MPLLHKDFAIYKFAVQKCIPYEYIKCGYCPGYEPFQRKLVFANGCFDLLHAGHINHLYKAKQQGDTLMVGINGDDSVRALDKGSNRPVINEQERALMVAALSFVDYVTIFNDNNVAKILNILKPDVWVKGTQYNLHTINQNERQIVESYGGSIVFLESLGRTTTSIIDQILLGNTITQGL